MKVYCEHGALTQKLKVLQRERRIELIHFPDDSEATTKHSSPTAAVSDAEWRDLNVKGRDDLAHVLSADDVKGSDHLSQIKSIIGTSHRRDALRVDSAYTSGCRAFVTTDGDLLNHREQLETLLGIRFFHPEHDAEALCTFIEDADHYARARRGARAALGIWSRRLHLPTLAAAAVVIVVWSLLSWRYGAYVLPSPRSVVVGLWDIVRSGEVWTHTGASLFRIVVGFGGAVAVSTLMGLGAFLSLPLRTVVQDALAVLNSTSVFVWIVISLIWFGLSNWAPIFTTFMITLPVVASNLVEGVGSVDRRLLEMGDVYRLSGAEKFTAIVVPSIVPYLIAGMKVGFGLALKVSVVAEIFGVTSGIGYVMNYSREILATQMVFAWALVMIVVMMLTDKLVFDAASRRLTRWR